MPATSGITTLRSLISRSKTALRRLGWSGMSSKSLTRSEPGLLAEPTALRVEVKAETTHTDNETEEPAVPPSEVKTGSGEPNVETRRRRKPRMRVRLENPTMPVYDGRPKNEIKGIVKQDVKGSGLR